MKFFFKMFRLSRFPSIIIILCLLNQLTDGGSKNADQQFGATNSTMFPSSINKNSLIPTVNTTFDFLSRKNIDTVPSTPPDDHSSTHKGHLVIANKPKTSGENSTHTFSHLNSDTKRIGTDSNLDIEQKFINNLHKTSTSKSVKKSVNYSPPNQSQNGTFNSCLQSNVLNKLNCSKPNSNDSISTKWKDKENSAIPETINLADSIESSEQSSSSHEVLLKTSANIKESFVITSHNNLIFIREKHFDPVHKKSHIHKKVLVPFAPLDESNKTDSSDFYFQNDVKNEMKNRNVRDTQTENTGKKIDLFKQLKQRINAEKHGNVSFNNNANPRSQNEFLSDENFAIISNGPQVPSGIHCSFETECDWTWDSKKGFRITNAEELKNLNVGPKHDASNNTSGRFLFLQVGQTTHELHVVSPLMQAPSGELCRLELFLHQGNMNASIIKIVGEIADRNHTQWVVHEMYGNSYKSWQKYKFKIGRVTQEFKLILEVIPHISPAHIALDNIRLADCYPEPAKKNMCVPHQFRCSSSNLCINLTQVCDINRDCTFGEDEYQNCDKMPLGSRCDFEDSWCGWQNDPTRRIPWRRNHGSAPINKAGLTIDHTYLNSSGHFLLVNMADSVEEKVSFAAIASVYSLTFNPPPTLHSNESSKYHNSCSIRFYYHQYGVHKSGLALMLTELRPTENYTSEIWWSFADNEDKWRRAVVVLPNITYKYYLQFFAKKGLRFLSTVAVDDVSLSPECFGLNIPAAELHGYNYWNPPAYVDPTVKKTHKDFVNKTYYEFTSCGQKGRIGPSKENCTEHYKNSPVEVEVLEKPPFAGVQTWIVPEDGYYTIIAKGASGGKGSGAMGSSRGAVVRTVMEFHKGERLYFLIGQEGLNACFKSLGQISNSSCQSDDKRNLSGVRGVLNMMVRDGGGGGGGATFVFLMQRKDNKLKFNPIVIAGGGGGLGLGRFVDNNFHHGQGINISKKPTSGQTGDRKQSSGAGGGLKKDSNAILTVEAGQSLEEGGYGGVACYESRDGAGNGGFGGGGGGCISGGGGGGYAGGNSWIVNSTNGEGGTSYITPESIRAYSEAWVGQHTGSGVVLIIPANNECGCDYRCLALDERRSTVACICPPEWYVGPNKNSCILHEEPSDHKLMLIILSIIVVFFSVIFGGLCFMLYNRHQRRKSEISRRKMLSGPELQLNRLRMQSNNMLTNPNYQFNGVIYTVRDLKDIPRNQLRLVKALGQGAFGEVYQGFYKARLSDTVEMPVAVKTLPELSTQEAEMDFLMEALIMSKFNHPNIVHFIGVCFDKHPRFIVLELLAGGDLKNFLRESRPKPERTSPLTMKDLVLIAIDVAKGCKYLEENRFIHRDIAARNGLLTTKGPGRVVKIADFGMSRDIYRSDYYRKGGKAMLPIKWMPPEAFLDGIFTSKTDVWSFGVLLWEIMSMGYMPYTGLTNGQVMQLVTSGGRLEPPPKCPGPIYGIMTQCWHPNPDQRPSFPQLLERLGYCLQDPDVISNPLPVFTKAPSAERDATVMRPKSTDDSFIQITKTTDYLVPKSTLPNELSCHESSETLLNDDDQSEPGNLETSFSFPQSKSTQPLLADGGNEFISSEMDENLININSPQLGSSSTIEDDPKLNHVNHIQNNNVPIPTNPPSSTETNLKSGVSLDANNLIQQTVNCPLKTYANVLPGTESRFATQNGPFTINTSTRNSNSSNKNSQQSLLKEESEISC